MMRLLTALSFGILSFAVLTACSSQTQKEVADVADSAQTDVALATDAVAEGAENAVQTVDNAASNAVVATADTVADGANAVADGANAVATDAMTAEQKVDSDQKY